MDLQILHKEHPFGDNPERSKKSIYKISDNCFRFWYKYVFLIKAGIDTGTGVEIADSMVFSGLSTYIGKPAFEEICMQYIIRQNKAKQLPFLVTNFGIWWVNDKNEKKNADLDIVADNKTDSEIMLFSQFTSMINLIKHKLDKRKISYFHLYGATKVGDRKDMVDNFNCGEKDVFLISLKAGGTGLNLTGADMVIHFDPWWNPAVEEQATDRAYRIGQKNIVQVFKLITKGSIEEKIFDLQQKKKELVDSVIKPGENFISKMNVNDIRSLFEN
jgi:SNF2 family DNA or RNA helicase